MEKLAKKSASKKLAKMFDIAIIPCDRCGADLSKKGSVIREYINKDFTDDDGEHSIFSKGKFNHKGYFEPDYAVVLFSNRYDLVNDSDTCAYCGKVV